MVKTFKSSRIRTINRRPRLTTLECSQFRGTRWNSEFMKKYGYKQLKEYVARVKICPWNANKIPLPPLQSYFTSVVHLVLIYLRSSSKRETDVLEITTFCLHLICCSFQDLYLNKVILRGVITCSISTRWQQRNLESENPEIPCVNNSRWGGGAVLFHLVILLLCEWLNILRTAALFFDTATWRWEDVMLNKL